MPDPQELFLPVLRSWAELADRVYFCRRAWLKGAVFSRLLCCKPGGKLLSVLVDAVYELFSGGGSWPFGWVHDVRPLHTA